MKHTISSRQLMTLTFVSMLSPFLRLVPATIAHHAGSAAWISSILSIFPVLFLTALIERILKTFPHFMGFSTVIPRILGSFIGKTVVFLWSVWLVFHSGFLLRSGADRFIATIYPNSTPTVFILITILLCTVAAFGHIIPLARSSELFRPLLIFVIVLVLGFTVEDVEPTFLLPATKSHIPGILSGLPLAAEAVSVALVNTAFLAKYVRREEKQPRILPWLIGVTVLNTALCAISVGSLGKTYTSALAYPFFIMARDLSVLSGVERIEALVVGLWLLPDFVLITVELIIASDNLLELFGKSESIPAKRICILSAAALASLVAFRIAPNSQAMYQWSEKIIPAIHLSWAYLVIPLLWITSRIHRKF